jgi:hypothetical protein
VTAIPILRYGHCNFTSQEVLSPFDLLVWQVNQQYLVDDLTFAKPEADVSRRCAIKRIGPYFSRPSPNTTTPSLPIGIVMTCLYLDGVLHIQQTPSGSVPCLPTMAAKKEYWLEPEGYPSVGRRF